MDTEVENCSPTYTREKRDVSPSSSVGSGGNRQKKKKCKITNVETFEGVEENVEFIQGKGNETEISIKKKVGRRSVKKAMEIVRKTGVEGLGVEEKGTSDVYKEFYEENSDNNGFFQFGIATHGEVNSKWCNISIDQLKEVVEMIGVSWVLAEEGENVKDQGREKGNEEGLDGGNQI